MLKEFDPAIALNEEVLICYFRNGLGPSIWAQSDKWGWDLDTWEQTIAKAINVETKTACQPQSLMKEMNSRCLCGHQPSKTNKPAKEQKNSNSHKSKPQEHKNPAFQHSDSTETSEKAWKEKKKNDQRNRRDCWAKEDFTLVTGVNTENSKGGNPRRRNWHDPAQVTCWNHNQKDNYSSKCLKPPKPKN